MNPIVKNNGLTYGIILGVISIVLTVGIYVVDVSLFVNTWVGIVMILVNIIIGFIIVSKTKKQLGGIISFKEAFTVYFIAAAIGGLIGILTYYVLFNFVDPQAKQTVQELTIDMTVKMMEKFGAPSDAVEEAIVELEKTDNYSLGNLLKSYVFGLVGYSILGLILALIFKSRPAYKE